MSFDLPTKEEIKPYFNTYSDAHPNYDIQGIQKLVQSKTLRQVVEWMERGKHNDNFSPLLQQAFALVHTGLTDQFEYQGIEVGDD